MAATGAIGMMMVGTGVAAGSAHAAGKYNKRVADQNAAAAEFQAEDAIIRGAEEEKVMRERIRGAIGTARVSYAGQGVDVSSGSAVDLQASIADAGERDALTIRNNAAREAWGYRVQAVDFRNRGKLDQYKGNVQAFNTVLSSFTRSMDRQSGRGR